MAVSAMLQLAGQFGPMGLLVAYLIWRERSSEGKRMAYDRPRLYPGCSCVWPEPLEAADNKDVRVHGLEYLAVARTASDMAGSQT
jgi:hypothetical protein